MFCSFFCSIHKNISKVIASNCHHQFVFVLFCFVLFLGPAELIHFSLRCSCNFILKTLHFKVDKIIYLELSGIFRAGGIWDLLLQAPPTGVGGTHYSSTQFYYMGSVAMELVQQFFSNTFPKLRLLPLIRLTVISCP